MVLERLVTQVSYDKVLAVSRLLDGLPVPWYISGGWAIDLYLGAVTREHADLEVGIARYHQGLLHAQLPGWRFHKILPDDPWIAELAPIAPN